MSKLDGSRDGCPTFQNQLSFRLRQRNFSTKPGFHRINRPRMSSSRTSLLIGVALGFVAGSGVGFFVSGYSAPERSASGSGPTKASAGSSARTARENSADDPAAETALRPRSGPAPIKSAELRSALSAMQLMGFGGFSSMRKMADLQARLRVSDLPTLAAELLSPGPQDRFSFGLVFGAFAEKDPNAAFALASSMKPGQTRQYALSTVIASIASQDPTAALAMIDALQDPQMKQQLRPMAIRNLAQKDPNQALELALKNDTGNRNNDSSFSTIFSQWAMKDIEGAKAALSRLSGRNAEQARSAILSSLAQTDPQGALNYAQTLPASNEKNSDPRYQVIQAWAESDPQAALKAAQSIAESGIRGMAVSAAVRALARNDFSGAVKFSVAMEDAVTRGNLLLSLSQNPSGNRKEILDAVLDYMPSGNNYQQAVTGIFSSWARENPAEAAAAVADLPPGGVYSNAVMQIAAQWATNASNKKEVFDWARQLPEGEARQSAITTVVREWGGGNPQDALNAMGMLAPEDRKSAIQSFADGWSRRDPEAVLRWSSTLTQTDERAMIVRNSVSKWANSSPEAAARYVASLPDSDRALPMQAVVNQWASKDTQAAANWLSAQPQGPAKDSSINALCSFISIEDPQSALAWAATITDTNSRNAQIESLARNWIRQDPSSARQWISTSTLSEESRKRLLK